MMEYRIYAGTYAGADENGIFRYRMDGNSQILERELALPGISNPSYLALSQNGTMMYAVMEDMEYHGNAGGGVCAIKCRENSLEILNSRGTTGTLPCHVTLDEEAGVIYAANYMSGSLSMFPLMPDGSLGEMSDCRQHKGKGPNPAPGRPPCAFQRSVSGKGRNLVCGPGPGPYIILWNRCSYHDP